MRVYGQRMRVIWSEDGRVMWSEDEGDMVRGWGCCGQRMRVMWSEDGGALVRGWMGVMWSEDEGDMVRGWGCCGQRMDGVMWSEDGGVVERGQRSPEALCSLHSEKLKLFCLDHQQPVCVVCRDSEKHSEHRFRPIDEAVRQHKKELQETLQPLKEKLETFEEVKVKFDETAEHLKVQARHTET
ncbi:hypothetical protein F7725_012259 [Dissostichus mawsoni]|uniref:B box-type domain-containing protein n=1 Tax=Dissostichus mawsoni TaxID=36200 RepID=A0A7J5YQ22_DISMA|nr:hypothetical protein F7725_012259 [Dissostichus mawsoni]